MTIIYTIGQGSIWGDNELRYSLRSLDQCIGIDRVIIAGYCPPWLNRARVRHIYIGDEYLHPHLNIMHKIEEAAKECSGDFVVMSDDHILLQPFDFDRLPLWHKGQLKTERENTYQASIAATAEFLRLHNLPTMATNLHFPKLYTRKAFEACRQMYKAAYAYRYGLEPSVIIGNMQISMGMTYKYHKDNKTEDPTPRAAFMSLVSRPSEEMQQFLAARFPDKSQYEL